MNLFIRVAAILEHGWGSEHLQDMEKLITAITEFLTSDYLLDDKNVHDATIDELIEFLQGKKSNQKPKDNDHA